MRECGMDSSGSGYSPVAGSYKRENNRCHESQEIFVQLSGYQLLKGSNESFHMIHQHKYLYSLTFSTIPETEHIFRVIKFCPSSLLPSERFFFFMLVY
jgi:hypothetical protein